MYSRTFVISVFSLVLISFSCKEKNTKVVRNAIDTTANKKEVKKDTVDLNIKPSFTYSFIGKKEWQSKKDSFEGINHLNVLIALNRADSIHIKRLDSIIIPNIYSDDIKDYSPFPKYVDELKGIKKIIFFSYAAQFFAAYENGEMVLTGPTNMGRKSKPTPEGLFYTNWKAKKTVSTVSDEWILKWNFNIQNKWGVGFHEYALPGYPASHSCMRLLSKDAEFLYYWANQWILKNNHEISAYGTPVIIFGSYPFGKPKPWYQLPENPKALDIPVDSLDTYIQTNIKDILEKQQKREFFESDTAR